MTNMTICVAGLGYVGLPLAHAFGMKGYRVIGFDVSKKKIEELKCGIESMGEVDPKELAKAKLEYTYDATQIRNAHIIIVTVPTPISKTNQPDTSFVQSASRIVGQNLKKGAIVVFESTVYPGLTEELCVPIIEKESGYKYMTDFFVGYSPERINPGDKEHTIDKIVKVVAGCDEKTTKILKELYASIIPAGIHVAPNIKTAESAKIIENIQRDLNIALMNELSVIFDKLGINTMDVLEAAGTKWNFHRYTPGLVGGHCIGIDPYYLTYKAKKIGVNPKIILAGREVNDAMHLEVIKRISRSLENYNKNLRGTKALIMGLTFKENIKDTRNSKTKNLIASLISRGVAVETIDPMISQEEMMNFGGIPLEFSQVVSKKEEYDIIVITVPHNTFIEFGAKRILNLLKKNAVFFDLKQIFDKTEFPDNVSYLSL